MKSLHERAPSLRVRGVVRLLARPVAWLLIAALPVQAVPVLPEGQQLSSHFSKGRDGNGPEVNGHDFVEGPPPDPRSALRLAGGGSGDGTRARRERAVWDRSVLVVVALSRNNRLTETLPHEPGTPNPPTTTYTYDAADNVLSVTDPENHRTEYTYNPRRQVLTSKDARGAVTTNVYDAKGNLTSTKVSATAGGPALTETSHTYDAKGNLTSQTVLVNGVPQKTTYGYEASGNLAFERSALGHLTTYGYDARGNRTRQTTTRTLPGGGTETLETRYEYDANNRLTKTIDPDGTFTRSVYDALGRQVESFDKRGHRTAYTYDEMGRLERTDYADATLETSTYDEEGRRLTSVDRRGKTTSYTYDAMGRLKRTTFPGGAFTENTYDAAGRLTAVLDARGKTTTYEYDRSGRRTKVTVPLTAGISAETVFTYDANGNQLTVRDPMSRTTTFEYDPLNRRTKTIFPPVGADPPTYTETTYDTIGRRTKERDQAGRETSFGYDALGRLTSVTDARGKVTTYGYDELGNRTTQTDAKGRVTAFEYDRLGREVKRTLPAVSGVAAFETKTYDDAGNLESRTDFADRVTAYTYDVMNRLLTRTAQCPTPPCVGAADVAFTYTASGRRETATDARGVTSWTYDDRDRLASLTYPDLRTLEYAYDANGNRTTLTATIPGTTPIELTTGYSYDDANRLDVVTDMALRQYDHGYDLNGNRISLEQPNGTLTSYTYDELNRLTNLTTLNGSTPVQSYALTLGPAGNRTQIVENDGTVRAYGYDELYRLTSDTVTIGTLNQYSKGFTYDDVGNRQTQTTTIGPAGSVIPGVLVNGTQAYTYDERDRLLTETLGASPATAYTWDADGNLITKSGEATYAWDTEMRMVRVTKTDGTIVEYAYDFDGVRVQTRTTPAGGSTSTTNYLVDTSGSLSHVVAETDATGDLIAHYVRGDDLLAVMRPNGSGGWASRFYHSDHIGSVRRLTDETGVVTDWYVYDAFGTLLGHGGTDVQPYAFTGEPYDPNMGFQYHRARWYASSVGRFVSIDPWGGAAFDPSTLHRYLYANASPVNLADPSGRSPSMGEMMAVGAIIGALTAVAIVQPRGVLQTAETVVVGAALGAAIGGVMAWWAVGGTWAAVTGGVATVGAGSIPVLIEGEALQLSRAGSERIWLGQYGGQSFLWGGQRVFTAGQAGLQWLELAAERYGGRTLSQLPGNIEIMKREIDAAQHIVFNISRLYAQTPGGNLTLTYQEFQYVMSRPELIAKTTWVTGVVF
jgi:RHS repeat-associated protein